MAKSKDKSVEEAQSFESCISHLESIVHSLEDENSTLESAMEEFEKGILLVRRAQEALNTSEQKVRLLMESDETGPSVPQQSQESQD